MRARAAFLLLLAAPLARAGDPPPADPIASAKKDFQSIKSLSGPADPGAALPTLDMKDLGPSPGSRPDAPAPLVDPEAALDPSKKKAKEGTGNWLVDAMDKKDDRQRSPKGRDEGRKGDDDLLRDGEKSGDQAERDPQESRDAREKTEESETPKAAVNPLDSFMAGWISTRDHDLLLRAKSEGAPAPDAGRAHAEALPDMESAQPSLADSMLPAPEGTTWADSRSAPNPFLAVLDLDPAPQVQFFSAPDPAGLAPSPSLASPSVSGADARSLDAGRTCIPDFAQPSDDDKYFKQMKKF
jgi:hypothetical protein